mmetsp:Transcript_19789/g.46311  ORF Transcript_19789/g.46311 Transcript_19789/m.46311 type:complete len:209 (+) Transcript_19789:158-784(+)
MVAVSKCGRRRKTPRRRCRRFSIDPTTRDSLSPYYLRLVDQHEGDDETVQSDGLQKAVGEDDLAEGILPVGTTGRRRRSFGFQERSPLGGGGGLGTGGGGRCLGAPSVVELPDEDGHPDAGGEGRQPDRHPGREVLVAFLRRDRRIVQPRHEESGDDGSVDRQDARRHDRDEGQNARSVDRVDRPVGGRDGGTHRGQEDRERAADGGQ